MNKLRIIFNCLGLGISIIIFSLTRWNFIPRVVSYDIDGWRFFGFTLFIALVVGLFLGIICYRKDSFLIMGSLATLLLIAGIIVEVLKRFCLMFVGVSLAEILILVVGVILGRMIQKKFFIKNTSFH
jgi:hypothetical protein